MKSGNKLILHILYSGLGGPGSVFFSLVSADHKNEFSYEACFCGIEQVRDEYVSNCLKLGIPYVFLRKKMGLDIKIYRNVYRAINKSKPSIIFLHGVSFIVPVLFYKLFNRGCKIVVRDTQAHHLKSKVEWMWMFFSVLFANRLILLTHESANLLRKKFSFFAKKDKFEIISNGLNTEEYLPKPNNSLPNRIIIGMQSRLQPIKDHITLLEAFKQLKDRMPDYLLNLEIAGDGVTREKIELKIEELGLHNSVTMHGMINKNELIEFMQTLDIYVHSTLGETLSNSIMQAMACGLPIIATNVWGVNNMIRDKENGLLFELGNSNELCQKLEDLIKNGELRKYLSKNSRKFAVNNYSDHVMYKKYTFLFNELLK